ncbi:MAG: MFS transporter [Candidatus Acidiferrum sp.]
MNGYEPAPLKAIARLSYYPWVVVGTTCIGAFIGQLDASIVQLTLPVLEREFHASLSAVSWVAIGYSLAFASILPLFARLSEIFGRKVPSIIGYALFASASALCGMASDLRWLVVFRIAQGVGGALLGANSITILVKAAGAQRRGRAMGIMAAAQAVGISAGPAVGGLLLAMLGWRWVFWASVPFALVGAIVGWLVYPQRAEVEKNQRVDWWGAVLLTPALTAVILMLSKVQAWGWESFAVIGTGLMGIVLAWLFVRQERATVEPLLDLQLFRIRPFLGGVIGVNLSYALLYSMFFLMSFAFVRGFHESPVVSGMRLAIVPVALGVVAPISGALYERVGVRTVTTMGMALCVGAVVLLSSTLTAQNGHGLTLIAALALFGIGLGMFIAPNNSATVAAAPENRSGQAGGLLNLMRVLGGTVGVAMASTGLSWRLQGLTGIGERTVDVPVETLLGAVSDVLWILGVFAIVAAGAAMLRVPKPPKTRAVEVEARVELEPLPYH